MAITARWSFGANSTVSWLREEGLGDLPVIHSPRPHPGDASRMAFKRDAILSLRREGWNPVIGIGDRPSDTRAYLEAGLDAIGVIHTHPAASPVQEIEGRHAASSLLTEIEKFATSRKEKSTAGKESGDIKQASSAPGKTPAFSSVRMPSATLFSDSTSAASHIRSLLASKDRSASGLSMKVGMSTENAVFSKDLPSTSNEHDVPIPFHLPSVWKQLQLYLHHRCASEEAEAAELRSSAATAAATSATNASGSYVDNLDRQDYPPPLFSPSPPPPSLIGASFPLIVIPSSPAPPSSACMRSVGTGSGAPSLDWGEEAYYGDLQGRHTKDL